MSRYEVKFVCDAAAHPRVLAELSLLPQAMRAQYDDRIVQSVYFDTFDRDALHDNLAGISSRRKLRFRWYGAGTHAVGGQLELKRRISDLGDKRTVPIAEPIDVEDSTAHAFAQRIASQCPGPWQEQMHRQEPVLWARYLRQYLVSADGRVRITLDRDFLAFDQRLGPRLQCRRPVLLPAALIVEIKTAADNRIGLQEIANALPLMRSKCSKFVWASSPIDGPILSRGLD